MDKELLILTTCYPFDNGTLYGSFVAEQAEHFVKKGMKVKLICPHHYKQKTNIKLNGVNVYRFKYFIPTKFQKVAYGSGIPTNLRKSILPLIQLPLFFIFFFLKTYRMSRKINIIYSHWTLPALISICIKKIYKSKKVVFMNHGAEFFVLSKYKLTRLILKSILKNCDLVISNSSYTFKNTDKIFKVKNHLVISPGVDENKFKPTKENLRDKYRFSNKDFVLFSLGNFIERKGYEYLIEAMNIIINIKKKPHIKLLMGGRGPLKSKYLKLINKYKLQYYITFTGYILEDDLIKLYSTCQIFVHPAIIDSMNDTEGLGVVLNEANACGTPVIASKVGGIIDVIKNGQNGLLVEEKNPEQLVNAILTLDSNKNILHNMAKNTRGYVLKNFTWKKNTDKTIQLIQNMFEIKS